MSLCRVHTRVERGATEKYDVRFAFRIFHRFAALPAILLLLFGLRSHKHGTRCTARPTLHLLVFSTGRAAIMITALINTTRVKNVNVRFVCPDKIVFTFAQNSVDG